MDNFDYDNFDLISMLEIEDMLNELGYHALYLIITELVTHNHGCH